MGLNAGDLDRRITIYQKTTTQADGGQPVESWSKLKTVWAAKQIAAVSEKFTESQLAAEVDTLFTIRYLSSLTITPDQHRIVCDGLTYNILGIAEIGRHVGWKISACARPEGNANA